MNSELFRRVIVPIASEEDAAATAAALEPYVDGVAGTVVGVHVIEKAGGAPDKASVEQREEWAQEMFATVREGLADADVDVRTEHLYGTDVAETIVEAAHNLSATAIVFTPRGGSRWVKLLTGDVTTELIGKSDVPIVVLPDREGDDESDGGEGDE